MIRVTSRVNVRSVHLFDEVTQAIESRLLDTDNDRLVGRMDPVNHDALDEVFDLQPKNCVARMETTAVSRIIFNHNLNFGCFLVLQWGEIRSIKLEKCTYHTADSDV